VRQIEERALLRLRRVAAKMGLIEISKRPEHTNIQPGWQQPKVKTNILGDSIPSKPYTPRNLAKKTPVKKVSTKKTVKRKKK
ncbi:MAG: hypothetical protein KAJ48_06080, partial [Elusimicrobiales bacterium]|nr:hypothetical protein [Elusimicrobiales bacterium]